MPNLTKSYEQIPISPINGLQARNLRDLRPLHAYRSRRDNSAGVPVDNIDDYIYDYDYDDHD